MAFDVGFFRFAVPPWIGMNTRPPLPPQHVALHACAAVQAGAIGLLGLGMNHVGRPAGAGRAPGARRPAAPKAKAVIYIFLSGGLAQHDSFDMKPDAPDAIRGEFKPIATAHARHPDLRAPADAGRAQPPVGAGAVDGASVSRAFGRPPADAHRPDAAAAGLRRQQAQADRLALDRRDRQRGLPAAQQPAAGRRAARDADPSHGPRDSRPVRRRDGLAAQPDVRRGYAASTPRSYGAWPEYGFHHARGQREARGLHVSRRRTCRCPQGSDASRFNERLDLLESIGRQQAAARAGRRERTFDRHRQQAVSLLADRKTQQAFDVHAAPTPRRTIATAATRSAGRC